MDVQETVQRLRDVCREVQKLVVGQDTVIRHVLAACVAGGHVLFEDVPGTGKTTLASAIATTLGLQFTRVQGTPDLLPSDLVGTLVFHPGTGQFSFREGPVFTQLLVMDEINRATPRTQSALLEAMAEGTVSVDGETHRLHAPFFVMATANPIESQGVFPLPEAQLDRFLVQLKLGYTSEAEELLMVSRIRLGESPVLERKMSAEQLVAARRLAQQVHVSEDLIRYIVRICRSTREHELVVLGASPRAVLSLTAFSQALALLAGRNFVTPDDVQEAWAPVMRHRIRTQFEWQSDGNQSQVARVLQDAIVSVPVPVEYETEALHP